MSLTFTNISTPTHKQASMSSSSGSNFVYIRCANECWAPARLIASDGKSATVQLQGNEQKTVLLADYPNSVLPLQNVDASGRLNPVEDMVHLSSLHEVSICSSVLAVG